MPRLENSSKQSPTIVSDRPQSEHHTGNWRSLRPRIDGSRCTGCLICWKFCPESCVQLTDKVPLINFSFCKGCGICVTECPPKCIQFETEGEA